MTQGTQEERTPVPFGEGEELSELEKEEIGRLISEGYTSGRLDVGGDDLGAPASISWALQTNKWLEE